MHFRVRNIFPSTSNLLSFTYRTPQHPKNTLKHPTSKLPTLRTSKTDPPQPHLTQTDPHPPRDRERPRLGLHGRRATPLELGLLRIDLRDLRSKQPSRSCWGWGAAWLEKPLERPRKRWKCPEKSRKTRETTGRTHETTGRSNKERCEVCTRDIVDYIVVFYQLC